MNTADGGGVTGQVTRAFQAAKDNHVDLIVTYQFSAPVLLDGVRLTVVGLLEKKGRSFDNNMDDRIYVPLTTLQKRLTGFDQVKPPLVENAR